MKTPYWEPPILVDTREPARGAFADWFTVPSIRGTIETGDYSLPGCPQWVSVERKELNDLINCLSHDRDRFERELKRSRLIKHFCVVVEAGYLDLAQGRYTSLMEPKAAWESVIALQTRYSVPFYFAGSRQVAARLTQGILLRWWKEHWKVLEASRLAIRREVKEGKI